MVGRIFIFVGPTFMVGRIFIFVGPTFMVGRHCISRRASAACLKNEERTKKVGPAKTSYAPRIWEGTELANRTVETSPQIYARVGGILYLFIIVAGIFAEIFVRDKLIISGDAAATAGNIVASEP